MDPKHFKKITQGGPIEDIMWIMSFAAVKEIERRANALSQSSNIHKAGLKMYFQMETDDTDGEDQTSNKINYFSNPADSVCVSESEANADFRSSILFIRNIRRYEIFSSVTVQSSHPWAQLAFQQGNPILFSTGESYTLRPITESKTGKNTAAR
ncbi:hypothetical protein BY996DRAFT_6441700 [Phakopsora pachyrhizi]|nr:hypothetical protein BY996DRAFT_6441700 [Phakopsora pachyrhizi]